MQLKRVTNHNGDNAPVVEVLYGWVNPDDIDGVSVNPNDWTSYEIKARADNKIDIYVNGSLLKTVDDANLTANLANNPYFGIIASVDDAGTVDALIDFYKVTAD